MELRFAALTLNFWANIINIYETEAIKLAVCIWINDFSFFLSLSGRGSAACFMAFGFELSRVDGEKLICFYANLYKHSRSRLHLMKMSISI